MLLNGEIKRSLVASHSFLSPSLISVLQLILIIYPKEFPLSWFPTSFIARGVLGSGGGNGRGAEAELLLLIDCSLEPAPARYPRA